MRIQTSPLQLLKFRARKLQPGGTGSLGHRGLFFLPARSPSTQTGTLCDRGHLRTYCEHQEEIQSCLCVLGAIPLHLGRRLIYFIHYHLSPTNRTHAYTTRGSPRLKLTQNTRLKANIRYLMHVSPPDSAAMAGSDLWMALTAGASYSIRQQN